MLIWVLYPPLLYNIIRTLVRIREKAARVSASRWRRRRSPTSPVALGPWVHGGSRPLPAGGLRFQVLLQVLLGFVSGSRRRDSGGFLKME